MRRLIGTGLASAMALSLSWLAVGCDGDGDPDAGMPDAGDPMTDAFVPDVDAFVPDVDAFVPDVDGGGPDVDAGPIGGGAATSTQIQAARDAVGAVGLPIDGAIVTYVKPALGDDDAGFFIQAEQVGPAIFVAVDPSTLTPAPTVGSVVSFTVLQVRGNEGRREVAEISEYSEDSSGHDVAFLVQDLSAAADIVSGIDSYESELVRVTASLAGPARNSGLDHVSIELDTTGVGGDMLLQARMPLTMPEELSLSLGCNVRFNGPMWRNEQVAQPSVYVAADVQVIDCPQPRLINAFATSATEVVARFDRAIDMGSITAPSTQFTITGGDGLTVSAATADGADVILTTGAQEGGVTYTLLVAGSVTDISGVSVDPAFDTDMFSGFVDRAELEINEINPLIANSCDLIELRVTRGGNLDGFTVAADLTTIYAFGAPGLAMVATNDIIVLHLNRSQARCRDASWTAGAPPPTAVDETTAVDEVTTLPANYATAFDIWSASTGLSMNASVITVSDTTGDILDAAAYYQATTAVGAGALERIEVVRMAGEWTDPGTAYDETLYTTHAIGGASTTNNSADLPSLQRTSDTDANAATDWGLLPETWGELNDGQSEI